MRNKDGIVITGAGTVSPAGMGNELLLKAVNDNISNIKKITKFSLSDAIDGGEIIGFNAEEYITDRRFRRIADVSKYAVAATMLAIKGSAIDINEYTPQRIGLIMCVTHGAIGYSSAFHRDLLKDGPYGASPLFFSDSVLNAPAGNVSNYFVIKGPVHTLIGGSTSVIEAITLARSLLASKKIDCCFIGAAEELNEMVLNTYKRFGFDFAPGEGAGMFMMERHEDAVNRKHKIYGIVREGISRFCCADNVGDSVLQVADRCLGRSGVSPADIKNIFINTSHAEEIIKDKFAGNKPMIRNISRIFGGAFCVTTAFHVIAAALMLHNSRSSESAMINAVSVDGNAASLIISGAQ